MNMKSFLRFLTLWLAGFGIIACGGGGSDSSVSSIVVVQYIGTLDEGKSISWSLEPGVYRLQLTSSNNGASVEWIPGDGCSNLSEVKAYDDDCTLDINGQVVVGNPTTFGLGPSETVTVQINKL